MTKNLYMEQIGAKAKKASINLNNISHNKKKKCFKIIQQIFKYLFKINLKSKQNGHFESKIKKNKR